MPDDRIGEGKRGPGRPPGSVNKITRELRDMILGALDAVGGEAYLVRCAEANPAAFLTLIGKVLPKDINLKDPPESIAEIMRERRRLRLAAEEESRSQQQRSAAGTEATH